MSLRQKVNHKYKVADIWYATFGTQPPLSKCFCPFHHNVKSPAAKIYDRGLVCFGECNKTYTAYDVLKAFNPNLLNKIAGTVLDTPKPQARNKTTFSYTLDEYYAD